MKGCLSLIVVDVHPAPWGAHIVRNAHTQSFARVPIEQRQHLVRPAVAQPVVDEVDRPDVARTFQAWPDHLLHPGNRSDMELIRRRL